MDSRMNRRQFAYVTAAALAPRPPLTAAAKWYERPTAGIHLDYHYPEWDPYLISKADGRSMIRKIAGTGARLVVVFSKCHYGNAYYNTRIGHKHKNLGDRDLFLEWVTESRKHDLKLLAYYSVDRDVWAGSQHPEWRMRDASGKIVDEDRYPPEWARMGYLCYNSPYLDFVKSQVDELLAYDIDGFHFDMLWFGPSGKVCYCDYCRKAFLKQHGIETPATPTWDEPWRKFLDFRYNSNAAFCDEVTALIRRKRPELSVMYNYHGMAPQSWQVGMLPVKHRLNSDYGTGEAYPPRFGHTYASFISCFLSGLKPGSPWQGVTSRYTRDLNDHTVRPLPDMKWELFTYLSHGGMPLFVDTPEDDGNTLDDVAYERMGSVFAEAAEKTAWFGYEPVRQCGLYVSSKTRDWYGREDPQRYFKSLMGAHRALVESHVPVGMLFDEAVTLEQLAGFPVVYLANTAILSPGEIEMFRRYVDQGGRLIATFETSRFDQNGNPAADFGLAGLLGITYGGKTEFKGNYFRLPAGPLSEGIRPEWDVFVSGPNNVVMPKGATTHGELRLAFHDRDLRTHIGHAPHNSAWKAAGPAVLLNSYGQGKTAYVPFAAEAAYLGDYPLPEHRLFIRNLVRHLSPALPVRVDAPLNVESVITMDRKGGRYIIHLIGFMAVRDGQSRLNRETLIPPMEESWKYTARVRIDVPFKRARAASSSARVERRGEALEIETGEVHDALIVEL
jgi:Hypothetical glycosyl hydrolase 6